MTDVQGPAAKPAIDLEAGRRAFLRAAGTGTALAGMSAMGAGEARAQTTADHGVAILNFALNLDHLQAEFYPKGVYGQGLPSDLTGGIGQQGGGVRGGSKVPFSNPAVQRVAAEIANDEKNHVIFLRSVLGSQAVAEPVISLDASFQALAQAAGIPGSSNPYDDDVSFLLAAYVFEDVGLTALNGAAPFIASETHLGAAASLLGDEAYHAATICTLLFSQQNGTVSGITGLISISARPCRRNWTTRASPPARARSTAPSRPRQTSCRRIRTVWPSPARPARCSTWCTAASVRRGVCSSPVAPTAARDLAPCSRRPAARADRDQVESPDRVKMLERSGSWS